MQLTREQIRDIFALNHGSASALARKLRVSRVTVTLVLRGKTSSKRILKEARRMARALSRAEESRRGIASVLSDS